MMLRLKKLRRQRDPTSKSATKFVAQRTNKGHRAHLVYRAFTRIGDEKVPDAKTLARLGQAIGPEVIGELH